MLLDFALAGTAAHVERFVRAWRRVDRVEAARETEARHLRRELSTWVDDDGMVVIRGRLSPEIGAVVQRALEAAGDRLFRQSAAAPIGEAMAEEVTSGQMSPWTSPLMPSHVPSMARSSSPMVRRTFPRKCRDGWRVMRRGW